MAGTPDGTVLIGRDTPEREDVLQLLGEHLADMHATSPPESVHALDPAALAGPGISFWTARENTRLLGCAALKHLAPGDAEIKSMRTANAVRGRGVASALLRHVLAEARHGGYRRLYLETGSQEFFAPARRLYERHGFTDCPPFAGYELDPNSVFMTLQLDAG
jgi:putative acetyltransferase